VLDRHVGRPPRAVQVAAVLLAGVSGGVDALAFVALGHVFAGVMTGNLVLLGLGLSGTGQSALVAPLLALAGYAVAVAAVALSSRAPADRPAPGDGVPGPLTYRWLLAEGVLLVAVAVAWAAVGTVPSQGWRWGLLTGFAVAMGIQSGALNSLGGALGPGTYFTGTLTQVLLRTARPGPDRPERGWDVARLVAVTAAAAATAALHSAWAGAGAFLPALLVAAALALTSRAGRRGSPTPSRDRSDAPDPGPGPDR